MEETFCKLEQVVDLNEGLEKENEELSTRISELEKEMAVIEQKFVENEDIRKKLVQEVLTLKEKVIELEGEKDSYLNSIEDIDMLMNKLHGIESENKMLKEKLTKTESEWTKIVDENIGLKLDLDEKCNEYEKVSKKLKEAEKKAGTLQHYDRNNSQTMMQPFNHYHHHPHIEHLNNQLFFLNRQYNAVCQERDGLRSHLNANQE